MCAFMLKLLALPFFAVVSVTGASPHQCKSDDPSTCKNGARSGGAMIQKPADKDSAEPGKLALMQAQAPLTQQLETLQADTQELIDRVGALSGQVGLAAPAAAAALQSVRRKVSTPPRAPQPAAARVPTPPRAPPAAAVKAPEPVALPGLVPMDPSEPKIHAYGKGSPSELEKFEDIVKDVERKNFPVLMDVSQVDDGTLKTIVEDLEVKIEDLKSKVLDLENMVSGTNHVAPVVSKPAGNETSSSLASRATVIELEVASLRTRVSSLEQTVSGSQTAGGAAPAA